MSSHQNLVAEYYAAFNARDAAAYGRLFTADCLIAAPGMTGRGVEAVRQFDAVWSSAFSEARIETLRGAESDGVVLVSNWFHGGTHVGPLQTPAGSIPATGRQFSAPYCATFEFTGDRISAQRVVFDEHSIPHALGLAEVAKP